MLRIILIFGSTPSSSPQAYASAATAPPKPKSRKSQADATPAMEDRSKAAKRLIKQLEKSREGKKGESKWGTKWMS